MVAKTFQQWLQIVPRSTKGFQCHDDRGITFTIPQRFQEQYRTKIPNRGIPEMGFILWRVKHLIKYLVKGHKSMLHLFNGHRIEARQHQVQIASPTEARIAENTAYGTRYHPVHVQAKFCTCYDYRYQRNDIPCTHAFALILHLNYPFPFVQFCSIQTWRDIYSTNFHPIVFGPESWTPLRVRRRTSMQCSSHLHSHISGTT